MSRAREFADLAGSADAGGLTGRNLIINGAMQVAQRGTSATNQGYGTVDRFRSYHPSMGQLAYTQEQSTDAPAGFSNSYKWTITTAETALGASEEWRIFTGLEGQDLQRLKFGTSDAESFTVSFWVKSSVTGTYTVYILDWDNSYIITDTYTIDTANTWEYKSVTFVGNPNQSFDNDNNASLYIQWFLSAGSDYTGTDTTSWTSGLTGRAYGHTANIATTANATFQLTGVQVEVGEKATPFEHRSYGDELARCQRYCHIWKSGQSYDPICMMATWSDNSSIYGTYSLPVEMRSDPTVTYSGSFEIGAIGSSVSGTTPTTNRIGRYVVQPRYNKSGHGLGSGISGWFRDSNDSDATITFDAEL